MGVHVARRAAVFVGDGPVQRTGHAARAAQPAGRHGHGAVPEAGPVQVFVGAADGHRGRAAQLNRAGVVPRMPALRQLWVSGITCG
jgi:hypothetical protein